MNIREKIYAILSTDAGVTALVAANQIKPPGNWQGLTPPYIVHFPVTLESVNTHGGLANIQWWKPYQVSCFGTAQSDTVAVANAVAAALGNYRQDGLVSTLVGERTMPFDEDVTITQIVLEFDIAASL